jgi:Tfp pilus assembly protein PilF
LRPDQSRYAYTLAFYQQQKGDLAGAAGTLNNLIAVQPTYADAYLLLGGIYEKEGQKAQAEKVYKKGLRTEGLPDQYKLRMKMRIDAMNVTGASPTKK